METNYMFEKLKEHLGHDMECGMYGRQNTSIECLDCQEVIYSVDNGDGYMYDVLKEHLGHEMEANVLGGETAVIQCLTCSEDIYSVDRDDI